MCSIKKILLVTRLLLVTYVLCIKENKLLHFSEIWEINDLSSREKENEEEEEEREEEGEEEVRRREEGRRDISSRRGKDPRRPDLFSSSGVRFGTWSTALQCFILVSLWTVYVL